MLHDLEMASGLWFCLSFGGDLVKAYKPAPIVYDNVCQALGLKPDRVMMVAAHTFDLNAAKKRGMMTALICRDGEPGSDPSGLDHEADIVVPDVSALADKLILDESTI
jgi:2-haloacid dehalogenase